MNAILRRRRSGGSGLGPYLANNVPSAGVLDFARSVYSGVDGRVSDPSEIVDYTGASNKTMVDASGVLKWAPHNLITESEDFSDSDWVKAQATVSSNAHVAPDGSTTADAVIPSTGSGSKFCYQSKTLKATSYTQAVWAKANGYNYIEVKAFGDAVSKVAYFNLSSGSVVSNSNATGSISGGVDGWYLCEIEFTGSAASHTIQINPSDDGVDVTFTGDGTSGIYVWGAHLYRSDLGGMANNPLRGDSYVPTAGSAVYMPRYNSHLYDSSTAKWNAHNLVTYSEDFSNAAWTAGNASITANDTTAPDSATTADLLTENTATDLHQVYRSYSFASGVTYTLASFVKSNGRDFAISLPATAFGTSVQYSFDLSEQIATQETAGTNDSASIEDVGNGWFLCSLTADATATSSNACALRAWAGAASYTGDGSSGVYLWGAHLYRSDLNGVLPNSGNSVSGYYVPTTGTAVEPTLNEVSWVNNGLLLESEARTNLVTYSEDFSNAAWTKSNSSVSSVSVDSPIGSTCFEFIPTTVSESATFIELYEEHPVVSGTTYTSAYLLKENDLRYVQIVGPGVTYGTFYVTFDLRDGSVTGYSQGTSSVAPTYGTISMGDGWYWVWVAKEAEASSAVGRLALNAADASDNIRGDVKTFNGTDSYYIAAAQFEQASTPSSYIPTNGSTATRAAETLELTAAKNPVLTRGPELVTNGGFDTDTTGWNSASGGILDSVGGKLSVSGSGGDTVMHGYQSVPTIIGNTYFFEATGFSASSRIRLGTATYDSTYFADDSAETYVSTFFVATTTTTFVTCTAIGDGTVSYFDNVSVREISMPTALSIAMKGTMTYADEDVTLQSTFLNWSEDANDYIDSYLRTNLGTGAFLVRQSEAGTVLPITGDVNAYSPGVNVPFNIASRHGGYMSLLPNTEGAFLASTDTADLVGSELVTNGDFATDSDWTKGTGWTITGGTANKTTSDNTSLHQTITTVVGQTYLVSGDVTVASGSAGVRVYVEAAFSDYFNGGIFQHSFVASGTSTILYFNGGSFNGGSIDNISVRLADPDISDNANGLAVYGTIDRDAVATGADLVGYSGFSA